MKKNSKPKTPEKYHKNLDDLIHQTQQKIKRHKFKTTNYIIFIFLILLCISSITLLNLKYSQVPNQPPTQPITTPDSTANWKTYETTLFSFKYPSKMTAGKQSANNNVQIYGPSNKKSVKEMFASEQSDENIKVGEIKKIIIDNKTAYLQKTVRHSRYYSASHDTRILIENVKYFEAGNWINNGILRLNIYINDEDEEKAENITNTIISTIKLVDIDQQENIISLQLHNLQFEIPKTWWFEYGINDTFKNEFYNIVAATNTNPYYPQISHASLNTLYEIGYYPDNDVGEYADRKYFSSITEQNIKIGNIEGLRIERTVSTNPNLNLYNWRYGRGEIIGTVKLYTDQGTYTLQGNITKPELRNKFDQILSTFKFIDDTSDWKTYSHGVAGFTFKYPNELTLEEIASKKATQVALSDTNNPKYITLNIEGGFDIELWTEYRKSTILGHIQITDNTINESQTIVDGFDGVRLDYEMIRKSNTIEYSEVIFSNNKNTFYLISPTNLIDQILSTFKFISKECPEGQELQQCKLGPCCCPIDALCD